MSLSKVSIIIINYNGKNLLETCLESLFKIDYTNFEVILVDNNSTDNSIEFITKNYPSIIIIKLDSNQGFAEPNNIASKIAKGKYLLFLNNDTIVTPKFISKMVEAMENDTKIGICQSMLLKFNGIIDFYFSLYSFILKCFRSLPKFFIHFSFYFPIHCLIFLRENL